MWNDVSEERITPKTEVKVSSETSVDILIALRYIPKDDSINNYRCENLMFTYITSSVIYFTSQLNCYIS
jgi:hypothetical protein